MVKTFGVDSNNDLYLGEDGNIVIKTDLNALVDISSNVAKAQRGEMVLFINKGIPNFQTIWVGNPNIPQFEAALRAEISSIDGVVRILELATTVDGENLNYDMTILTQYGTESINGSFSI